MSLSSAYVARETAGNLRRNLLMTFAAIVTMAVSLTALGAVLVMRQAIAKASVQWRGGVEMAIFLNPSVSATETSAIRAELSSTPGVKTFHYVDKPHAYQEFKEIFGGNNDIVSVLNVSDMPPSFRVVPTNAQDIAELGRQFQNQPGVLKVSYAQQEIDALLNQFHRWRTLGFALAIGVLVGAVALIVNTIQLAIFARRREVAVMKLVGATNWFIRIPFMLEGFIHGMVGAIIAFGLTYVLRDWIASFLPDQTILGTNQLFVTPQEAVYTGLVLLAVGAAVGVLGSAFAVRRYLSV
ncbi:MAG TPA: permease-like cell division protein FtsX [Acidimicrobiales bacterium]|nr:permease-like cell division protein FtsX [Acidimicrobiales bacterium]